MVLTRGDGTTVHYHEMTVRYHHDPATTDPVMTDGDGMIAKTVAE